MHNNLLWSDVTRLMYAVYACTVRVHLPPYLVLTRTRCLRVPAEAYVLIPQLHVYKEPTARCLNVSAQLVLPVPLSPAKKH